MLDELVLGVSINQWLCKKRVPIFRPNGPQGAPGSRLYMTRKRVIFDHGEEVSSVCMAWALSELGRVFKWASFVHTYTKSAPSPLKYPAHVLIMRSMTEHDKTMQLNTNTSHAL